MRSRLLLLAVVSVVAPAAAADPPGLSPAELDKRAVKIVYEAEVVGVRLWTEGKHEDCLRVYQATLMALAEVLDHRPDVVKTIKNNLEKSAEMSTVNAAFVLRRTLDEASTTCKGKAPLYDRLGGGKAENANLMITFYVQEFLKTAAKDAKLTLAQDGRVKLATELDRKDLEKKLVQIIAAATGGPTAGAADAKKSFAGLKLTDAEFNALTRHLAAAMTEQQANKADLDEFLAVVESARPVLTGTAKKSLWDRLGGEAKVRDIVTDFLTAASKDPKVNADRGGNYPPTKERGERVTQLLVEFISSLTGGPLKYTGRDMKNAHLGMKITADEFQAAAGHMIAALKKHNVVLADIDELMGLVATAAKDVIEVKK
jgi:hemoglobin